jgi:poly-gamma-glutamate synthesis protein (capsule biosynthesis protein)
MALRGVALAVAALRISVVIPVVVSVAAWGERPSVVILPFEQLEPRWKVLEVDGLSPIRKDFDASRYPLVVTYGISGQPWALDDVRTRLPWPSSNRDPAKMTTLVMTGVTALTRGTAWLMDEKGVTYRPRPLGIGCARRISHT